MLNSTQRTILAAVMQNYIEPVFDELTPEQAITVLRAILTGDISQVPQDFELSVKQIIEIFEHPCPQNRGMGDLNALPDGEIMDEDEEEEGIQNGIVYFFSDAKEPVFEQQGLLGLTARNDGHTEPVTKEDVVSFISRFIKQKLLVTAIEQHNRAEIARCLDFDLELLTLPLREDGCTAFHLIRDKALLFWFIEAYIGQLSHNLPNFLLYPPADWQPIPLQQSFLDEQLLKASKSGDLAQVKCYLVLGANINTQNNKEGDMNFYQGPTQGARRSLLGAFDALDTPDGCTPLHYAVIYGKNEVVTFLFKAGADYNRVNHYEQKPLQVPGPNSESAKEVLRDLIQEREQAEFLAAQEQALHKRRRNSHDDALVDKENQEPPNVAGESEAAKPTQVQGSM